MLVHEETTEMEGNVQWTARGCREIILVPTCVCNTSGNTFKEWKKRNINDNGQALNALILCTVSLCCSWPQIFLGLYALPL